MRQSFTERPRSANPNQDMAGTLHSKSLLQSRNVDRLTGSKFFNDNRIRTCSYIKQNGNTFTAVPFYDKRNTKQYPTKSQRTQSWTSQVYSNKNVEHAGMGHGKTLSTYHPDSLRSRVFVQDYVPPLRNMSSVVFGDRSGRDTKHYTTSYNNSFKGSTFLGVPDSHPGITAYKNRWVRRQIDK